MSEITYETKNAEQAAEEAARLLQNDAFNAAYSSLVSDIEKKLFMSDLGAQAERETLFHLHRAAQMFANNIASRINHFQLMYNEDSITQES
jgi:hypothetical protein